MRVVFDSNIIISALVFPGGKAERAFVRVLEQRDQLVIFKEIIQEVVTVLARKFSRDAEAISRTAVLLSELGEVVLTGKRLRILKDESDNRIVECALAGHAECIATGDKEMLALKEYRYIKLLSLADYLSG